MIISFIGHSSITSKERARELVKDQIRRFAQNCPNFTCYVGGYGDFDELSAIACYELKREINIEVVYVTPYLSATRRSHLEEMKSRGLYDSSVYPPIENVPLKFAISKRNEWMMSAADLVIAYVSHSYGGAYKELEYKVLSPLLALKFTTKQFTNQTLYLWLTTNQV